MLQQKLPRTNPEFLLTNRPTKFLILHSLAVASPFHSFVMTSPQTTCQHTSPVSTLKQSTPPPSHKCGACSHDMGSWLYAVYTVLALHGFTQSPDGYAIVFVPCSFTCRSSLRMRPHLPQRRNNQKEKVQWSEDVIKADPFFRRSRVRFRVPPWVSNTIARDHLA